MYVQRELYFKPAICSECQYFISPEKLYPECPPSYGKCRKKFKNIRNNFVHGSMIQCKMEDRKYNDDLFGLYSSKKISLNQMYKEWRM